MELSIGNSSLITLLSKLYYQRANPLPKPHRTGEYGMVSQTDQEMLDYGPASYVPGDRWEINY